MKRINRDVLESYVACHYKAYLKLKLAGDENVPPDKTNLLLDGNSRLALSSDTVGEVHLRPVKTQAPNSVELTSCYLRKAEPLILGGVFETDRISLQIEGLQRVTGSSDIGDFHYLPLVFQTGAKVHETLNLLLDVYGFILSSLQGRSPDKGIIRKSTGKSTTVQLSPAHKKGELIINALSEALCAEKPPILILNKHCEICEFQSRCHAQAVEEDNLSLLRGISESEIMRLRESGIFTINQLSYTFRPRRVKKRSKTPARTHYFALQARALREKHIFIHGSPNLNAKDARVYLDLEGTKTNGSYYLIGLLVDHAGETHQKSFWADRDDGEAQIFMEMLDYLKSYGDYSVLHYGAYEVRALRRMQKRLPEKYAREIEGMLKRAINVLAIIGPHIYFPVYSNSLKEIAGVLGHKWSAANASGAQAVLWRRKWDETQDPHIKDELVRYNMEDCIGLKIVSNFIEQASQHRSTTSNAHTSLLHTDDFEQDVKPRGRFQKQTFVLDAFDYINRCSYFDYQRDKMSARRTRRRQQGTTKAAKPGHKAYKNNKVVEIFVSRCPVCRSRKLSSVRPLKRQIVDLKFSGAAVRRWVVVYLSQEYRCRKCQHKFIPEGYPKTRTPFGKGLMFWCIYQMVVGEQNMLRIREGLVRMFGIQLQVPTIYNFKQSISFHYRTRYNEILSELLNSHVLYIDETAANLRSETGYVWCITDGHSVHYIYRDSREGSFLIELFKNFRGVLVSDFYTAYDSLDCRQQRCLVHLMRDFNEEMQRHPFDSELKLICSNFSTVLKGAVATIDRYGFKRRHLAKHIKTANDFCRWVSRCEFGSKPAERLRSRIVKYRDQLFTFLDVDGVSWNNTNAEHFIKPFAWYRRTANGVFTERSIRDYLVILSIAETIGGRGGDLLEFLLRDNERSFSFRSGRRASAEVASQMSSPRSLPSALG